MRAYRQLIAIALIFANASLFAGGVETANLSLCRLDWNLADVPQLQSNDCFYCAENDFEWTCQLLVDVETNVSARLLAVSPLPTGLLTLPIEVVGVPVAAVDEGLFDGCIGLESVAFPGTLPSGIASCAFPDSVTSLVCRAEDVAELQSATELTVATLAENEPISGLARIAGMSDDEFSTLTENGITWYYRVGEYGDETNAVELLAAEPLTITRVEIPSTLDGNPVRWIGDGAFCGCTNLVAVSIPDTIVSLGPDAFANCEKLIVVVFAGWVPDGAEDSGLFGANASKRRYYCSDDCREDTTQFVAADRIAGAYVEWLYSDLDENSMSFGGRTMGISGTYAIPSEQDGKAVVAIGEGAFATSPDLTSLFIPDTVTNLAANVFADISSALIIFAGAPPAGLAESGICRSAFHVRVPSEYVAAYREIFADTATIDGYYWNKEALVNATDSNGRTWTYRAWKVAEDNLSAEVEIVRLNSGMPAKLSVPAELDSAVVSSIADSAFDGCGGLRALCLPTTITRIGSRAFAASSLQYLSVPSSVVSIGTNLFADCQNCVCAFRGECPSDATAATFAGLARVLALPDNLSGFESVVPSSVALSEDCDWTTCASPAIDADRELAGRGSFVPSVIVVPNAVDGEWVSTMSDELFANCSEITSVTIAYGITTIGSSDFSGCSSLSELVLPETIFYIFGGAFSGTALREFNWPWSIAEIGGGAFANCTQLKKLTIGNPIDASTLNDVGFGNIDTLVFPDGYEVLYTGDLVKYQAKTFIFEGAIPWNFECAGAEKTTARIRYPHRYREDYAEYVPESAFAGYQWIDGETFTAEDSEGRSWSCEVVEVSADGSDAGLEISSPVPSPTGVCNFPASLHDARVVELNPYVSNPSDDFVAAVIPSNVVRLADRAFYECSGLSRVSLPVTLEEVGDAAFRGTAVKYLRLPSKVSAVGTRALVSASDVVFMGGVPQHLEYAISSNACVYCTDCEKTNAFAAAVGDAEFVGVDPEWLVASDGDSLSVTGMSSRVHAARVAIPNVLDGRFVTSIGEFAFACRDDIIEAQLFDGISVIPRGCFSNCVSLARFELPDRIVSIGANAFTGCESLALAVLDFASPTEGLEGSDLLATADEVELSDSVTSLTSGVFTNCLATLISFKGPVPEGLAESGVTGLVAKVRYPLQWADEYQAYFPVARLGGYYWEAGLASVYTDAQGYTWSFRALSASEDGAAAELLLTGVEPAVSGDLIVPGAILGGTVVSLNGEVFAHSTELETLVVEPGPRTIGDDAFFGCTSLKSVTLPDTVTALGAAAFGKCTSLEKVELGNSLEEIGQHAFRRCYKLANVSLPQSLRTIRSGAFEECAITTIVLPSELTDLEENAFSGNDGCELMFRGALPYCYDYDEMFDSVAKIWILDAYAESFADVVPSGVERGKDYDWRISSCGENEVSIDGLESELEGEVKIPSMIDGCAVKKIGSLAFMYRSNITSLELMEGIESVGDEAFHYCTNLRRIVFPSTLQSCGDSAFAGCSSLDEVEYSEGTEVISGAVFLECPKLRKVHLPSTAREISDMAFCDCVGLTEVNFPAAIENIRAEAFENTAITNVDLSNTGIREIGYRAFCNCTNLTEVSFEDSFWRYGCDIGEEAFAGCTSLTRFVLPGYSGSLGADVFKDCVGLTNVVFASTLLPTGLGDSHLLDNAMLVEAPLALASDISTNMPSGSVFCDNYYTDVPVSLSHGVTLKSEHLDQISISVPTGCEYYDVVRANGAARLKLTERALPGVKFAKSMTGSWKITLSDAHAELQYHIEWKDSLSSTEWHREATLTKPSKNKTLYRFLDDTTDSTRFYRVVVSDSSSASE